ncbi:MAG: hypothetical protein LBG47_00810 [Prevotellaceae bacterium]|jgi:predicted transposase YdaD|nr:hypothetical protein [Prevotellaceae bacterium]
MEEHKKSITEYYDVRSAVQYAEKIGMEKGVEIGMEKSRQEIAQRCALKGMPIETIAKLTGLTAEQAENIIKNTHETLTRTASFAGLPCTVAKQ